MYPIENGKWTAVEALWNIRHINRKYRIASSQVMLLDNQIRDVEQRILRCQSYEQMSTGYTLSLRLLTLENLRKMFFIYAGYQAELLETLQTEFVDLSGFPEWSDNLLRDPDISHHIADMDYEEDEESSPYE